MVHVLSSKLPTAFELMNELRKVESGSKIDNVLKTRWILWRIALPASAVTGIIPEEILSGGRKKMTVIARRLCFWTAWTYGGASYNGIGSAVGFNHSTVRHGVIEADRAVADHASLTSAMLRDILSVELEWSAESEFCSKEQP